ncbi:hypothetical protein AURDEDRAFT_176830 [Auricularia subglabra TFB-10046 SS5]|nr:hypothetical protein AURDEDRAFT_176830 [Auricularia subglabra TFB-10046 SS5]
MNTAIFAQYPSRDRGVASAIQVSCLYFIMRCSLDTAYQIVHEVRDEHSNPLIRLDSHNIARSIAVLRAAFQTHQAVPYLELFSRLAPVR